MIADLRAAIAYAASRPDVDPARIHVFGYCAGGGYAVAAAAENPAVRSLTLAAGWFISPANVRAWFGEKTDQLLADAKAARAEYEATGRVRYMFAAHDSAPAAMGGFAYYTDPKWAAIGWANLWAPMAYEPILETDVIAPAARVTQPTLVIHTDGAIFPAGARDLYAALPAKTVKELRWQGATPHLEFYVSEPLIAETVAQAAKWYGEKF
jgi:uncharacterized protein